MNSVLRYVVLPWQRLSGFGNWSYAVSTEWVDRGIATPGSSPPEVFSNRLDAEKYAKEQSAAWPYRSEACYLTDVGKYVELQ